MHRASDRGEETAGGFPDGEICNEEVGDDNRDSVLYLSLIHISVPLCLRICRRKVLLS